MVEGLSRKPDGTLVFKCPVRHCHFTIALLTPNDNLKHKCPFRGTTTLGWGAQVSILEKIWLHADEKFAELMNNKDSEILKGYLRGISYTLAAFMPPHFTTPDEVARELKRRYAAIEAGETYETPGIGSLRMAPPTPVYRPARRGGYTASPAENAPVTTPATTPKRDTSSKELSHKFTPEEVEKIQVFAKNGFTPEDLSRVHGVSPAVIRSVLSS